MAAREFKEFQDQVEAVIQDQAGKLSDIDRDRFIRKAITQRYSEDRPIITVVDAVSDGTQLLALPDPYEEGFSFVKSIEYPIGQIPPKLIEDDSWQEYRDPTGLKLMLSLLNPTSGEKLRLTFTSRHNSDGKTVPDVDFYALCDYAASLCLETLAALYAQTGDPTVQADVVNYRTKSSEYLTLAKAARARYYTYMGVDEGTASKGGSDHPGSIAMGDLNETMSWGGDRMTHGRPR